MQKRINLIIFLLLGLGLVQAQGTLQLRSVEFTISGTSSLHDWTSASTTAKVSGDLNVEKGILVDIPALQLSIPVTSIKSEKGKVMDNKTHGALLSDKYPNITFKLQAINSIDTNGNEAKIKATGLLTIAGASKTVQLTVKGLNEGNGTFRFTGSKALKMTDFGIDPPTALLGTLKTGDDITVAFNLSVATGEKEN